jgi:hypothetical protein
MGSPSIKMYDKLGQILRLETTSACRQNPSTHAQNLSNCPPEGFQFNSGPLEFNPRGLGFKSAGLE